MAEHPSVDFCNGNNPFALGNCSGPRTSIYTVLFTPAGSTTKLALVFSMLTLGVVGFVGGSLILYFLSQNKQPTARSFMKNLNLYIKSLALSDILCSLVSLPLVCLQISFDLFQTYWACRIVRYINMVFPIVTIYNLVVIAIEKHLSLRRVPRTLRASTVRKLISFAWLAGFAIVLLPAATFTGLRKDLNETHFTVLCTYDKYHLPSRIIMVSFTVLVYYIPCIFLIIVNVSLIRKVWLKVKMTISVQVDNPMQAKLKAAQIRGTLLLIAITFAFIIPYFVYIVYLTYNIIATPEIDFQTDCIIRFTGAVLAFSNSAVNFVIYVVQMRGFRTFLRKLICRTPQATTPESNNPTNPGAAVTHSAQGIQMAQIEPRDDY